jgi:hypothetical protein
MQPRHGWTLPMRTVYSQATIDGAMPSTACNACHSCASELSLATSQYSQY